MESNQNSELVQAASLGNIEDARRAIKAGADINCPSDLMAHEKVTPLMLAVNYGYYKLAEYLIAHGADIGRRSKAIIPDDPSRETALHWAAHKADLKMCRLLIAAGADARAESTWGSVLQYAIESKNPRIVRMVIDAGAPVNQPSGRSRYLPLHIAAREGDSEIIQLLLKRGAKLASHPQSGETPLIMACLSGKANAVRLLLAVGDNPERRDRIERRTPLMWAVLTKNA
jgi:ankyrin repeat protein